MINTDSKVFMIVGKSYSGKDTLLNKIFYLFSYSFD